MGSFCLMGWRGFFLQDEKSSGTERWCWLHNNVSVRKGDGGQRCTIGQDKCVWIPSETSGLETETMCVGRT